MNTEPELHSAIERDSAATLSALLAAGADPNRVDAQGNTALHLAAVSGRENLAALLLAHAADWRIRNRGGRTALALDHIDLETLHRIRQHYRRLVLPPFRDTQPASEPARRYVTQLRRDGLVRVRGLVDPSDLQSIREDVHKVIGRLRLGRLALRHRYRHYDQKEYWQKAHRAYVYNDALACSAKLIALCCHPVLVDSANHYLGRTAHIKRVYGMRYLPRKGIDTQQFGWHHDMEDRLFKVMILLTDLTEDDQYMSYVRGSHKVFHPYECFLKNNLSFGYYGIEPDQADIVKTLGKAGDVFLFDPNGMHRGNRSLASVRDALFIEFTVDGNLGNTWGSELPARAIDALAGRAEHPLRGFAGLQPKWKRVQSEPRRRRPTWAESLQDPQLWVCAEDQPPARGFS